MRLRFWVLGSSALLVLVLGLTPAAWADGTGRLRIEFVAVGQGDAALVTSPTGKTVLVDGGPREAGQELAALIEARTPAPLDLVLLTHRHADHLGGLAAVIERRGARLFMDAAFPHPSPAYAALIRVLEARRIPIREAERGRAIDLGGGARMRLLAPPSPIIAGSRSDVNANSVVALLEHGRVRVLFTGDAEAETERWLLGAGVELGATVLKVAHHGSRFSSTLRFLRAVGPRVAIVSAGRGNEYGHPHPQVIERLARVGAAVYRTDIDGTITVWSDGREIGVEAGGRTRLWSLR